MRGSVWQRQAGGQGVPLAADGLAGLMAMCAWRSSIPGDGQRHRSVGKDRLVPRASTWRTSCRHSVLQGIPWPCCRPSRSSHGKLWSMAPGPAHRHRDGLQAPHRSMCLSPPRPSPFHLALGRPRRILDDLLVTLQRNHAKVECFNAKQQHRQSRQLAHGVGTDRHQRLKQQQIPHRGVLQSHQPLQASPLELHRQNEDLLPLIHPQQELRPPSSGRA